MDPDCFERGDTVRVVNMPHVIFVFISSTDNGYSRLMMQLPVSTTEQNYVTTLFVRVQSSNVVLPESMAMRDRQAIEDQHLSPTLDCAPVKKKFTRGIEIVDGRKEYRWTISSRKYLPTLLKDFRLRNDFSGRRNCGLRVLCLLIPGPGRVLPKSDYSCITSDFDVALSNLPETTTDSFLDLFIGPLTGGNITKPRDVETIIGELYSNIASLQLLSLCNLELRCRIETYLRLWERVFWETMRTPIDRNVLLDRRYQWTYKDQVISRLSRDPKCRCNTSSWLIHAFTLTTYCSNCFNQDMISGKLALSSARVKRNGTSTSRGAGRFSAMTMPIRSPFSGNIVATRLVEDMKNGRKNKHTTTLMAVEPAQALELMVAAGVPIASFVFDPRLCTLRSIKVHNTRGFPVLNQLLQAQSLVTAKRAAAEQLQTRHNAILRTLAADFINTNSVKNVQMKRTLMKELKRSGILLLNGTVVEIHTTARISWTGSVVNFVADNCYSGEKYIIRGQGGKDVVVDRLKMTISKVEGKTTTTTTTTTAKLKKKKNKHRKRKR